MGTIESSSEEEEESNDEDEEVDTISLTLRDENESITSLQEKDSRRYSVNLLKIEIFARKMLYYLYLLWDSANDIFVFMLLRLPRCCAEAQKYRSFLPHRLTLLLLKLKLKNQRSEALLWLLKLKRRK
jgi:hypothetical protein